MATVERDRIRSPVIQEAVPSPSASWTMSAATQAMVPMEASVSKLGREDLTGTTKVSVSTRGRIAWKKLMVICGSGGLVILAVAVRARHAPGGSSAIRKLYRACPKSDDMTSESALIQAQSPKCQGGSLRFAIRRTCTTHT